MFVRNGHPFGPPTPTIMGIKPLTQSNRMQSYKLLTIVGWMTSGGKKHYSKMHHTKCINYK